MRGKICRSRRRERKHEEKGGEYCIKKEGLGRREIGREIGME
jgi:hypothetical protein